MNRSPGLVDYLFALLLYLLPHHALSRVMHWITRCEWPAFKNLLIRQTVNIYNIDMTLAEEPDPEEYPCFNAFFTRPLRAGARPLSQEEGAVLSPVDAAVSQAGRIENGRIFQAKGQDYTLEELVGGDRDLARLFEEGSFATLYLSPRDYHRIHMPLEGRLQRMTHVPGRLFSVSPSTTRTVPRLFSRNERIVNLFETEAGPLAVILVGAIFVASMETVWAGTVTPQSLRVHSWHYGDNPTPDIRLPKGEEMGRFNMGSTVILLFGRDAVRWSEGLQPDAKVRMGEKIGAVSSSKT